MVAGDDNNDISAPLLTPDVDDRDEGKSSTTKFLPKCALTPKSEIMTRTCN